MHAHHRILHHNEQYTQMADPVKRRRRVRLASDVRFVTVSVPFGNLRRYACKVKYLLPTTVPTYTYPSELHSNSTVKRGGGGERKRGSAEPCMDAGDRATLDLSPGQLPSPCPSPPLNWLGTHTDTGIVITREDLGYACTESTLNTGRHGAKASYRRTDARRCWGIGAMR
jgi:hypothetical protein